MFLDLQQTKRSVDSCNQVHDKGHRMVTRSADEQAIFDVCNSSQFTSTTTTHNGTISELVPSSLYVGSVAAVQHHAEALVDLGVTDIVNVALELPTYSRATRALLESRGVRVHRFPMRDEDARILARAADPIQLVCSLLGDETRCTFVHCFRGISRSAAVAIGALHASGRNATIQQAYEHVRACRRIAIQRTPAFLEALDHCIIRGSN